MWDLYADFILVVLRTPIKPSAHTALLLGLTSAQSASCAATPGVMVVLILFPSVFIGVETSNLPAFAFP